MQKMQKMIEHNASSEISISMNSDKNILHLMRLGIQDSEVIIVE